MISIKLMNYLLLENKGCSNYANVTYDENYFYACSNRENNVTKLNLHGCICDVIETQSLYKSICFDKKEDCFWAIKSNHSNYIYKLNRKFKEVDSFIFKELYYDYIENISYKISDDTLLLSSRNSVYNASKQGEVLFKYNLCKDHYILSSGEIGKNLVKCSSYSEKSPVIINIIFPNHCEENLNCLAAGHKAVGIFPACYDINNSVFYIATVKNNQFAYLLKYEFVNVHENECNFKNKTENTKYLSDDDFICIKDINIV